MKMTNDEIDGVLDRLTATREQLVHQLWATACKVTGPEAWEQLRELARLRADIEGLDFALENHPREEAGLAKACADAPSTKG